MIGILVLYQIPTLIEIAGILLVTGGVALHHAQSNHGHTSSLSPSRHSEAFLYHSITSR